MWLVLLPSGGGGGLVAKLCPALVTPWTVACQGFCLWDSLGKSTGVGCHFLLQGIFPTQESNPGLLHCRKILYQLSHNGTPRILEWVAHPFSSRSSPPRNRTRVSCIAGGLFTNWAIREAHNISVKAPKFLMPVVSPQPSTDNFFCLYSCSFLENLHKWNHATYLLLCLTFFT